MLILYKIIVSFLKYIRINIKGVKKTHTMLIILTLYVSYIHLYISMLVRTCMSSLSMVKRALLTSS